MLSRFLRSLKLAVKNILLHKMRSALTVLGIVFGVCSVIAMLAIGEGASWEAQEQIKRQGSTNVILRSVKPPESEKAGTASRLLDYGLRYVDARRIADTLPGVRRVVSSRQIRQDVYHLDRKIQARIVGTTPDYTDVSSIGVARGRFLTALDNERVANVAVLGSQLVYSLFPGVDCVGRTIKIGSDRYRIVGTLAPALSGAAAADDPVLFIPLTTAVKFFGEILIRRSAGSFEMERIELHEIIVQLEDKDLVMDAAEVIRDTIAPFHKSQDWEMIVPLDLLRQAEQSKRIFDVVLGSIAAISLLVGGIGIMNIMLATVTERTREIGIRRALGARKRDIMSQFLAETIVLSGGGGILGVILGVLLPLAIQHFAHMMTIVRLTALLLAFGISVFIGIVFGIYPARRAADMDPIEALRHE
ncbi:MAG: ABC transporter permease [Planctomycetota bacterium]